MKSIAFLLFCLFLGITFYFIPELDLGMSALFYNPHRKFYLSANSFVRFLHQAAPIICLLFAAIAGINALIILYKTRLFNPKHYIKIIYVTLVCLIGPGAIIHGVVKETYDRARPHQIAEFGGDKIFTPAFMLSNQCKTNCSFVSGHASVGFMFYSLAFLLVGKRRVMMNVFATFLGLLFGLTRIMEGGHFLSDVLFSGIIVYSTASILNKIIRPLRYDKHCLE